MNHLEVYLPFPPSVNTYWRRSGHHMHISARGREYRAEVLKLLGEFDWQPFGDSRVKVRLALHRGDRRSYDVDNFNKALFDAFTHAGVWEDDSQIDDLHVKRGAIDPQKSGFVHVLITELDS
jgi:crossover junction endodeoxyribonuclease RusA